MKKNIVFIMLITSASFLFSMHTSSSKSSDDENPKVAISVDNPKPTPLTNVPVLNFTGVNRAVSRRPVGVITQRKAVVKSQVEVGDLVRAKSQYRDRERERQESSKRSSDRRKTVSSGRAERRGGSLGHKERIDHDRPSEQPQHNRDVPISTTIGISDLMDQIADQNTYSEDDMWDLLLVANPVLHDFSAARGLAIAQVREFGQAMQDFEFKPQVLIQFLKNNGGFKHNKVDDFEITQYNDIRKKDPRKYKMLLLELIERIWAAQEDAMANSPQGTLMHNTHLGVQAEQIESQKTSIFYRTALFLGTFIVTLGTSAWGIYGQARGNYTAT